MRGSDPLDTLEINCPTLLLLDDLYTRIEFEKSVPKMFVVQVIRSIKNDKISLIVYPDSLPNECATITSLFPEKARIITQYQQMAKTSKKAYTRHIFLLLASVARDKVFQQLLPF